PHRLQPMPGLLELLAALEAAGIPKAIATSSPRAFVDVVLGMFQLAPRFSFILTSEDIEHGKPEPDVYLLAAARHSVAPPRKLVPEGSQTHCPSRMPPGAGMAGG